MLHRLAQAAPFWLTVKPVAQIWQVVLLLQTMQLAMGLFPIVQLGAHRVPFLAITKLVMQLVQTVEELQLVQYWTLQISRMQVPVAMM
jgi:hypothetical protein